MAQILVRNLDKKIVDRLKRRAKWNGKSLQSELKGILEQASRVDAESARKLADEVGLMFKSRKMASSVSLIREGRNR